MVATDWRLEKYTAEGMAKVLRVNNYGYKSTAIIQRVIRENMGEKVQKKKYRKKVQKKKVDWDMVRRKFVEVTAVFLQRIFF